MKPVAILSKDEFLYTAFQSLEEQNKFLSKSFKDLEEKSKELMECHAKQVTERWDTITRYVKDNYIPDYNSKKEYLKFKDGVLYHATRGEDSSDDSSSIVKLLKDLFK